MEWLRMRNFALLSSLLAFSLAAAELGFLHRQGYVRALGMTPPPQP